MPNLPLATHTILKPFVKFKLLKQEVNEFEVAAL